MIEATLPLLELTLVVSISLPNRWCMSWWLICNAGDLGSIPGLGRFLEEGMATHSSIIAWRIPMNRGAWQAPWGHKESDTTE